MNRYAVNGFAALMALSAVAPAMTTDAEARRGRGAAIGAGVALGILGAAAIAGANRSYADDGYGYDRGYGYRDACGKWAYRCDRGSGWACDKYERNC